MVLLWGLGTLCAATVGCKGKAGTVPRAEAGAPSQVKVNPLSTPKPAVPSAEGASTAQANVSGPVQLVAGPHRKVGADSDIEMFPRVLPGPAVNEVAAAKINASLDRWNAEVMKDARECSKAEAKAHPGEPTDDWERSIEVTMRGPGYLSLVATDDYDCGGPHPDDDELALVYDLSTGMPVNWLRLLPQGATGEVLRSAHRLPLGVVHWPLMVARAIQQVKKDPELSNGGQDCVGSYSDPNLVLDVWLSTKDHAVVFSPELGSHYEEGTCSETVEIGAAEAERMGFAKELTEALKATR